MQENVKWRRDAGDNNYIWSMLDTSCRVNGMAFTCSFECTFCAECADGPLANTCPNCLGELLRRPRRKGSVTKRKRSCGSQRRN